MLKFYGRCITCRQVKSKVLHHGLCTPLPVSKEPWVNMFMNFIIGLSRSKNDGDSIFGIVDMFSKVVYFIFYYNTDDTTNITDLFFMDEDSLV